MIKNLRCMILSLLLALPAVAGADELDALRSKLATLIPGQTADSISLSAIPGVKLIGTAAKKASVLSFIIEGVHPHDAGSVLDYEGVAVRTGHHCAQPVMDRFGVPATIRASLGVYNTREDIDTLVAGIRKVQEMFA